MDSLWGYKDKDSIVIKPQFQYAFDFLYGKGVVFHNKKAGVINSRKEIIIPFNYDQIHFLNISLIRITNRNRTDYRGKYDVGVITESGKEVLPMVFNSIYLKNDRLFVEKRRDSLLMEGEFAGWISKIRTYGIFSPNGEPILEPIYDSFEWIKDGLIRIRKGQYYAIANSKGELLTDLKYTGIDDFYNGKSKIRVDSSWGFINIRGEEVIPPKYKMVSAFYTEKATYRKHNGNLGFIDTTGAEIFESNFEILREPHLGCAAARKKGKWGMISTAGKILIPFKHDDYVREFEGVIAFKRKGKWAIFNQNGKQLTKYEFDSILIVGSKESPTGGYWKIRENQYNQPIALVTKGEQKGVINIDGEFIIPLGLLQENLSKELEKLKLR